MTRVIIIVVSILPAVALTYRSETSTAPRYTQVYALKPRESVFAYARVSPNGRQLVYASRAGSRDVAGAEGYTESVVDLESKRVQFSEPGMDAYWSPDGTRIIYSGEEGVTIRNVGTGAVAHRVAPGGLGDYYSWGLRDGRDLILTIDNNYYYLDGSSAVLPFRRVQECEGIGTGERPLISKDGTRVTTFVRGNVVVRNLDTCGNIIDTGIQGAKADFSFDGRYIAFHALRTDGLGYEVRIVDLDRRTVRTLTGLGGSALFPSWTQDGRLCFRYDGPEYRGFMMASGVLDAPSTPLPTSVTHLAEGRTWQAIFPEIPSRKGLDVVLVWAPWSAHSEMALGALDEARNYFAARWPGIVTIRAAADPTALPTDVGDQLREFQVSVPQISMLPRGLMETEARNQMPTTLLFRDGVLVDRRLGAQSFGQLRDWVAAELATGEVEDGAAGIR